MTKFHAGWYLFYTKPRHEKKVQSGLAKMEINSFLPTKKPFGTGTTERRSSMSRFSLLTFLFISIAPGIISRVWGPREFYIVSTPERSLRE